MSLTDNFQYRVDGYTLRIIGKFLANHNQLYVNNAQFYY